MLRRFGVLCLLAAFTLPASAATLTAFRSEDEFVQALTRWRDEAQKLQRERRREAMGGAVMEPPPAPAAQAPSTLAAKAADAAGAAESITNVQTAGVDEGGIVKRAGDHLVILRRGRLFTVRIGGDTLQPAATTDAYAPGSNPHGAWYDELLIAGSTVVVIGYSYARGGTEVGLFELGADGALAYRATYHLRSFDYYSSRNYASRLIGRKLVFYTPTFLQPWQARPWDSMPGLRRWRGEATPAEFERILPATRIYRSDDDLDPHEVLALHTVTTCELGTASMQCESSAVLGPAGRVFYVSQGSVYVWTSAWRRARAWPHRPAPVEARPLSAVFRLPLDGAAPSALKTAGVPIDQLSFLEDAAGHLNVLLRESGAGEGMWGSERTRGSMALLRVPLSAFGDGRASAQREHYRVLPAMAGHAVQNRYVGDWLLWGGAQEGVWALRYAAAADAERLEPGHAIERIEAMGDSAVLVGGANGDLHFSSVRLRGRSAELAGRHVQPGASQGETRTHGFFFRPTGRDEGVLGLPVLDARGGPRKSIYQGVHGSASVLYLRQRDLAFSPLGQLHARPESARDDGCKASCVDWYGNARPLFIGDRVFALLGYELVEGQVVGGRWSERIEERRRASFAPREGWREGRYSPFN
ncbi:beta-propeller domain-containing protein [Piscinibacter sp. XHJ-5]|uniref:beta-propeller domain-containing protein n=1 Tax=Piscinibacter sp. XHJ-5 TaxID=3037797 RepID=UPI00245310A2|nr:beta-propeller domain-containing protein [Piscinibacter sp. XHJ-5]